MLSPSSDSHEQGGLTTQEPVTIELIMDCPTITVHASTCYKALIDSEAAISLIRYSTYQLIYDSFKAPIQPTTTTLNTANGSPMTALGMTVLHLRIADFRFTHNFIICDRLPDTEIIFGIDVQKKFSLSYAGHKEKCYMQKDGRFCTYTQNCEQKVTIGIIKSTLKIPCRHGGIIPINIKGNSITGQMTCFISNQESTKGKDPNINIVTGIHNIKGKTSVNILVSNYSNKHVTFNKREYVGHLDHINEEEKSHLYKNSDAHTTSSVTTKKMMSDQVEPDAFEPPYHKLLPNIKAKLETLLKEYESQFA